MKKIYNLEKVNTKPIVRAFKKFENFRSIAKTEIEHAGVIQAFEYCFELSWKTMKKILETEGLYPVSPRETFRVAAKDGLIDNPEIWFDFLEKRNLTSHTYEESEALIVLSVLPDFAKELRAFIERIGLKL